MTIEDLKFVTSCLYPNSNRGLLNKWYNPGIARNIKIKKIKLKFLNFSTLYILNNKYGKKITNLYLVCIHPDNPYKTYERIEVPFLDNEIKDLFELRLKEVQEMKSK